MFSIIQSTTSTHVEIFNKYGECRRHDYLSMKQQFSGNSVVAFFKKEEGGGTGLLEKPKFETPESEKGPKVQEGGEMGNLKQRLRNRGGDKYRVLLLDHERHTEQYVTKTLPTILPGVSADDAQRAYQESKEVGAGLVLVAVKEHAEFYAMTMMKYALRATIEPDGYTL